MRLFLDEDIASNHLGQALRKAGHDVVLPAEVGRLGKSDPVQLVYAVENDRVFITANCDDFGDLHDLVVACQGIHPGILTIRKDNDKRRDMKPGQIVRAIAKLDEFLETTRRGLYCLNDWQ